MGHYISIDFLDYICRGCSEMCQMYKTKFGGRACSSQIIFLTKKQNLKNFKIDLLFRLNNI